MAQTLTDRLNAAFTAAGAVAWGGVAYEDLAQDMDDISRAKAAQAVPNPATVLVAAFPYFTGKTEGNLSLYARGQDYHGVLRRRLDTVSDFLCAEYPSYSFLTLVDSSPLPERQAAWRAGLGLRGKNRLFILPPYGSYVFLGTILTDAPMDFPKAEPAPDCMGCDRCISACPSGALKVSHMRHCLSNLTQKRSELTPFETVFLQNHPLVWGCDTCQRVCPYNQAPLVAFLPEFAEGYLSDLTLDMLEGLTNKTFAQTYGGYAFAWRGPTVLRRNLKLKEE